MAQETPMTSFPNSLNTDSAATKTSSEFADRGDGTSKWFHWFRIANGGDAAKGSTSDAAVTDPTATGSVIALLKGLLTFARVSAAGVGKAEDAAAVSGDTGVMALAIRRDTPTSDAAAGDYHALHVDQLGRLRVIDGNLPGYPPSATPLVADSGIVANAAAVATLTGAASVTTYITGFQITAAGATAAAKAEVTIAGILGGTISYVFTAPAGVDAAAQPLIVTFPAPLPASAANTSIVVTLPDLGAGNTHAAVVAHGFRV
jgi:hypothetical protein